MKLTKILLFVLGGLLFSGVAYGVTTQTFVNPIPDANISSSATWNAKITTSSISESITGIDYNNATGVFSQTAGYEITKTASSTNWNTAYDDRLKWDGGATGLVAATGRTSLGLTDTATTASSSFAKSSLGLTAGSGLTGGGDLTADRTFTIGAGTNIVVNADDVQTTSTPAFTKVIYPDTSYQTSAYKPLAGASIYAPTSTASVAIGRPFTTSTAIEAWCQTTGSNIVVNFQNDGVAFATTTATQAGNTSSSLSVSITNKKNIAIGLISFSAYDATSTLSCAVYGTN